MNTPVKLADAVTYESDVVPPLENEWIASNDNVKKLFANPRFQEAIRHGKGSKAL